MRYYKLEFESLDGKPYRLPGVENPIGPIESRKGLGLNLDFDIQYRGVDVVRASTKVVIRGLPLQYMKQGSNFKDCIIRLTAGFEPGLPIAKKLAPYTGRILLGRVVNSWSDWQGDDQKLNLIVDSTPRLTTSLHEEPFLMVGKKGEKLSAVIKRCFEQAFGINREIVVVISDKYVLPEDMQAAGTLRHIATTLREISREWAGIDENTEDGREMIQVLDTPEKIAVFDESIDTYQAEDEARIKNLQLSEIIGQPYMIGLTRIGFKTSLRADLRPGDHVFIPESLFDGAIGFSGSARVQPNDYQKSLISGGFNIVTVNHIGGFNDPDGNSAWVTLFEAIAGPARESDVSTSVEVNDE